MPKFTSTSTFSIALLLLFSITSPLTIAAPLPVHPNTNNNENALSHNHNSDSPIIHTQLMTESFLEASHTDVAKIEARDDGKGTFWDSFFKPIWKREEGVIGMRSDSPSDNPHILNQSKIVPKSVSEVSNIDVAEIEARRRDDVHDSFWDSLFVDLNKREEEIHDEVEEGVIGMRSEKKQEDADEEDWKRSVEANIGPQGKGKKKHGY